MKKSIAVLAISLLALLPVHAGQLTLAVVQFSADGDANTITSGLAGVNLAEATNGERASARGSSIDNGLVLFSAVVATSPGSSVRFSARQKGQVGTVDALVTAGAVRATVTIDETIALGLKRFSTRSYSGDSALPGRDPVLLKAKKLSWIVPAEGRMNKGGRQIQTTVALLAQYLP